MSSSQSRQLSFSSTLTSLPRRDTSCNYVSWGFFGEDGMPEVEYDANILYPHVLDCK